MSNAVVKGAGYILIHTPDMILHNGTTQTMERLANPESEYLKKLPNHFRSYEDVVSYPPNQAYIGTIKPEDLRGYEMPWYKHAVAGAERYGKLGEIMPQEEFIGLMKISDVFDLVKLEKDFTKDVKEKLSKHPLMKEELVAKLKDGDDLESIEKAIKEFHAEALYHNNKLVGCVKRAHDIDPNLNAHIIHENLITKASGLLA
ncbi:betaine reductase, partial [Alkaliphilus peptidifermentans DSM 18978]